MIDGLLIGFLMLGNTGPIIDLAGGGGVKCCVNCHEAERTLTRERFGARAALSESLQLLTGSPQFTKRVGTVLPTDQD